MFENLKKFLKSRQFFLCIVVMLIAAAMILKLFNLQIVNGNVLNYYATRGAYSERTINAPRGNIYDRNGKLIAYNRTGYSVKIVKNTTVKDRNKMYLEMMKIFRKNGDSMDNTLVRYLTSDMQFGILVDEKADKEQEQENFNGWISFMFEQFSDKKTDRQTLQTPQQIFEYMREKFAVEEEYSERDAYDIVSIRYTILRAVGFLTAKPHTMASEVSIETMSELETRHMEFPGIYTDEVYFRQYVDPQTVSHVLGYVRAMSEDEYTKTYKDKGYSPTEFVGKEGIEYAAEDILRGIPGVKKIYMDTNGREIGEVSRIDAIPGKDLYLTVDIELQKAAREAMIKNVERVQQSADNEKNFGDCIGGAIAVMDVNTGDILTSLSYPDYDPNIFLAPRTDKTAQEAIDALYRDDKRSPSLNRVTQGLYAPGSTFKPIVAIAGLEKGTITSNTVHNCSRVGVYNLKCLGYHSNLTVIPAMIESCNIFFYNTGIDTKIETVDQYTKLFGLGELTGTEISEFKGSRSNPETMKKKDADKTHVWTDADTAQTSIGQLYTQFTPIQLARFAAALGTRGTLMNAHYIKKTVASDGTVKETEPVFSKIEGISQSTYNTNNQGMIGVIGDTKATIYPYYKDFGFDIAGKTGTPETGLESQNKSSHGVFICYAPAENPQIAVSVVLEHGVWGTNAAILASDVVKKYFGMNVDDIAVYEADTGKPVILN